MRTLEWRLRPTNRAKADIGIGENQAQADTSYGTGIAKKMRACNGPENNCHQWQSVSQICNASNISRGNRDNNTIAYSSPQGIFDPIGFLSIAEHLGQLLTTAPTLFVTATATTVLDFNDGFTSIQRTDCRADGTGLMIHDYQRRSGAISSKGRNFAATASRARKMRERTVPIGQSIMLAISS